MLQPFTILSGAGQPTLSTQDYRAANPSLEGIGTPWVCDQESHQHPVSLDTKPHKMTAGVLNLYGSFLSSITQ